MNHTVKKRRAKAVLLAAVILLLGATAVCNVPWPMEKICRALEIRLDDEAYLAEREIRFAGRYHVNLFSDDMFSGTITISGYPVTATRTAKVPVRAGDDVFLYYGQGADAVPLWPAGRRSRAAARRHLRF